MKRKTATIQFYWKLWMLENLGNSTTTSTTHTTRTFSKLIKISKSFLLELRSKLNKQKRTFLSIFYSFSIFLLFFFSIKIRKWKFIHSLPSKTLPSSARMRKYFRKSIAVRKVWKYFHGRIHMSNSDSGKEVNTFSWKYV